MTATAEVLERLAGSQLEHVLLALRDGDRAYNLRDVLDPWWCYERGGMFVGSRRRGDGYCARSFDNPCPAKKGKYLSHFDWSSARARAAIEAAQKRPDQASQFRLVIDHSVPLSIIARELWRDPKSWSRETLKTFLRKWYRRAVISYEDDQALNRHRLKSNMPGEMLSDDPFARYRAAGFYNT